MNVVGSRATTVDVKYTSCVRISCIFNRGTWAVLTELFGYLVFISEHDLLIQHIPRGLSRGFLQLQGGIRSVGCDLYWPVVFSRVELFGVNLSPVSRK